jgi:hypothetical protein
MHKLHRALAPSGLLFLEVPDASRFVSGRDAPFQEFSVEHINYFSGRSLATLARRHGFAVVDVMERDRSHTEGHTAPVVAGVFRKQSDEDRGGEVELDATTAEALRAYVEHSTRREQAIRSFVAEVAARAEPVVVWGCGTLTLRLLASSELSRVPVAAFVDSNARYWGKTLRGVQVVGPEAVRGRSEPILVSSVGQQASIARHIREQLGYPNEVLTFPAT